MRILGFEDRGNGTHRVTIATKNFERATLIVPTESILDPGLPWVLQHLHDMGTTVREVPRQSAKDRRRKGITHDDQ